MNIRANKSKGSQIKTWFKSTSSFKKRKQRETIFWLLLILFFTWLAVATLKAYVNSLEKESVASLQTSQLSLMRSYAHNSYAHNSDYHNSDAYKSHDDRNYHTANYNVIRTNENANIIDDKALLNDKGSSLIEKQKLLRATRMHNTLRAIRRND